MPRFLLLTLLVIFFSVITDACDESRLDVQPTFPTESGFYKNDDDFFMAITGVYAKLTDLYYFSNNNPNHDIWMLPGDDLTSEGEHNYTEFFYNVNPRNEKFLHIWNTYFCIISRANLILEKIDEAPGNGSVNITEETSSKIRGEALFLRSLAYYKIWNFWGTAPLINGRIKDVDDTERPNSKDTELLDQAINDLREASSILPEYWDEIYKGRITRDGALGLLGKCLVFRADYYRIKEELKSNQDYLAAIEAFNEITTRTLDNVRFADNFDFSKENNDESLFEWQASKVPGFEKLWLNNDWDIGAMHAYWGFFNCAWSYWDGHPFIPTEKLIHAFEPGDPRITETFDTISDIRFNGYAWQKYIKNMGPDFLTASINNPRILRFADVLLLKAEAILQSGGDKSMSVSLINQVRRRARGSSSQVPEDLSLSENDNKTIMQWIMDERFRELSGEDDHRWFDLKRWHYAGFIDLSTWDGGENGFSTACSHFDFHSFFEATTGKMWFPIPSAELQANRNIVQNPGY